MNESNRTAIILFAAAWIVLMAVIIFLAWTADRDAIDALGDFVEYLDDHRDNASRLIVTLGALVLIVLALLIIILELAPEEETREIKVEQAGATTIVPAEPLRLRLEEALTAMPNVTAARARVFSQGAGLAVKLDLTVTPGTNVAAVTQDASRVVEATLQTDLGLALAAPPTVRILFGPPKPAPVASSVFQAPSPPAPAAPVSPPETQPEAEAPAPAPEAMWPAEPEPPAQPASEAPAAGETPPEEETPQP